MNDLGDFMDCLADATKQLVGDIEDAWNELKEELRETVTVKYLRPGGVACCRGNGRKYYGIITGTQIIALDADGEPEYLDPGDFLAMHGADKLKVAAKNRIALGAHAVDFAARLAVEEERFPSTGTLVLKCLDVAEASNVDAALERKFGSFEWLTYDIPEEAADENGEESAE